jgi:exopolysaccharide biosynthesis polyprenyl glycosylphosphotransferase
LSDIFTIFPSPDSPDLGTIDDVIDTSPPGALDASLGGGAQMIKSRPTPVTFDMSWSAVLLLLDLAAVAIAAVVAEQIVRVDFWRLSSVPGAVVTISVAAIFWLLAFERIGMYRRSFSTNGRDEIYASLAACAMAMLPGFAIFLLVPSLVPFRHLLIGALLLTAVFVCVGRYAAHVIRAQFVPRRTRRIAVVGSPARVAAVPKELSLSPSDSVLRLAIESFDEDVASAIADGDVTRLDWVRLAIERNVEEIVLTEALPADVMPVLLRHLEAHGVKLALAPLRIRPFACDFTVRRDGGLALLYPRSLAVCRPGAEAARRIFDLALAVPALVVLAPVFAAIALAIRLDSPGPIFYRQRRVGRRGRLFDIVKFRTMRPDAESASGPVWALPGESRTTRLGAVLRRLSLDELPQLLNVVRGEMSIVGPRPERPFYVEQFRKLLPRYDERHLVRPGITGWSHVNMRRNVDTSAIGERLSYDLFYLEHWSIFMDILIVCKTGAEFLFHSPA